MNEAARITIEPVGDPPNNWAVTAFDADDHVITTVEGLTKGQASDLIDIVKSAQSAATFQMFGVTVVPRRNRDSDPKVTELPDGTALIELADGIRVRAKHYRKAASREEALAAAAELIRAGEDEAKRSLMEADAPQATGVYLYVENEPEV
jgi:hypothetical protein